MSEDDIMRELRANGPLSVDFDAGVSEFFIYNKGIMTERKTEHDSLVLIQNKEKDELIDQTGDSDSVNQRTTEDYRIQWQVATHSVLLIGWGYDEKEQMKYWIARNSYGEYWGEQGNFRVRRGMNDFGFESNLMAVDPVLLV